MSTTVVTNRLDIEMAQNDDAQVDVEVLTDIGSYDLTGKRVEILVKKKYSTPDADALYVLSSDTGEITILDAAGGLASADFTDRLADAGTFWYHAYVASAADADVDRRTFAVGELLVAAT